MKKTAYGVIGIKGAGHLHCRAARQSEKLKLAAVADIDAALVKRRSEELQVRGFTDYRDLLVAGLVEAVSIATPHHLHAPIALDCLNAGLHVFIEKPFANCVSEADRMIDLAKTKNLKICVGHQYRLHRSSQAMKELIDAGAVGRIMRVLWTWGEYRPESWYSRDSWRGTWQGAGGGVLMSQASHDLDLLCWMAGAPVEVSALIGNQLHAAAIEDIACANIRFANGALCCVQATANQPRAFSVRQIAGDKGIIVLQDVSSLTRDENDRIEFGTYEEPLPDLVTGLSGHFDQPRISWGRIALPTLSIAYRLRRKSAHVAQRLGIIKKREEKITHATAALMDSFADSIVNGGEPLVNGEDARVAVELINAMVLSAIRKKTVTLPLDRDEYDRLFAELGEGKIQVPRPFH